MYDPAPKRSVFLIGPMGSGKTAVGRRSPAPRPAVRRQRRRGRVAHRRRHRLHFRARGRGGLPYPRAGRDRRIDPGRQASCSRRAAARCSCPRIASGSPRAAPSSSSTRPSSSSCERTRRSRHRPLLAGADRARSSRNSTQVRDPLYRSIAAITIHDRRARAGRGRRRDRARAEGILSMQRLDVKLGIARLPDPDRAGAAAARRRCSPHRRKPPGSSS